MPLLKDYYKLLEIAPTATADEVKRAFRTQIARYHPDKVQHLGQEFQAMAGERAADLTEAYRVLSDEGRRGEYDRARGAAAVDGSANAPTAAATPSSQQAGAPPVHEADTHAPPTPAPETRTGPQFRSERASRDEFVRKATVSRMQSVVESVVGGYDQLRAPGFDLGWSPKKGFLGRTKGPHLLCKFITRVDGAAVKDAWTQATKSGKPDDDVCVLLVGSEIAPAGELAAAIAEQRRRQRTANVTLIPVDARTWDAHMPLDAPAIAKALIARLKSGR